MPRNNARPTPSATTAAPSRSPRHDDSRSEELEAARRRTSELATLLAISMALPATTDLDRLLQVIMARSVEPFEAADAGVLFLYDPQEEALIAGASIGYRQEPLSQVRLEPGEAIAGKVFALHRPMFCANPSQIADAIEDVREENRAYLEEARGDLAQPQSAICVPLLSKGSAMGALILVNLRRQAAFSSSDLHLLQAIANQIAIVVENARLWSEVSRADALEEANRLKDEFLSGISHELLTPITAIRAAVDILEASLASDGTDQLRSLAANISRNTLRLQGLVQQLLDLARLRSGALTLALSSIDLRAVLRDSVASVQPLADEKGQTLTLRCPTTPCPVRADRGRLEQLTMNLLSNACKFTPKRGTIRVSLREDGDRYIVSVADTGPGIAPSERKRIFERFYSRSRGRDQKAGTGLGLAIAKALVELHGGQIWVESRPGRGSTFYFSLLKERDGESAHRR